MSKKHNKKTNKIQKDDKKIEYSFPSYFNYIPTILLLFIFILSLYIRAYLPYDVVFNGGVIHFASDDSVYQMRLVENTIANFPHRLTYDAFTRFPTGELLPWGPLFTIIIATASMIIGFGNPSVQLVNTVGAFTPAIMGAVTVFPVYYIAKHLFNSKPTALISALMIAILPGQWLGRSVLGFTDHHVAEVLFSTTTLTMFIIALKSAKINEQIITKFFTGNKSVIYSVLAGVFLSSYLLTWAGAPFFIMIIFIFLIIQSIIDNIRHQSIDYLKLATAPMFIVSLIFLLPFVNFSFGFIWDKYSLFHVTLVLMGILLPIILTEISKYSKNQTVHYMLFLFGLILISLLLFKSFIPQAYDSMVNAPRLIFKFPTGGGATIGEANSILERPGMLQSSFPITFLSTDGLTLLFILISLLLISIRIIKQKSFELLFVVWSAVMLLAVYGQNRFAYYFAVNFAIISGFIGGSIIDWQFSKHKESLFKKDENGIIKIVMVILTVVIILVYPSFNIDMKSAKYANTGDPSGGGFSEWYETLTWMRNNTPDTGLDYYGIYTRHSDKYPYPPTAYGVLSWWDYGHTITYYAHRIPTANPFQSGIGRGTLAGASTFLTAKTEEDATRILKEIGNSSYGCGVRYIISDSYMAYEIMHIFGIWNSDVSYFTTVKTSKGDQVVPNNLYYENMEARLHIFDGNKLTKYRLVHESKVNPNNLGGYREQQFKYIYNSLYGGHIPIENSGLVKIFEFVEGAKIEGTATANTEVIISNRIRTNVGREFDYTQKMTSDNEGRYSFVVPYSTTEPLSGQTNFDTKPIGKYKIIYGNVTREITVNEYDVLKGNTINV